MTIKPLLKFNDAPSITVVASRQLALRRLQLSLSKMALLGRRFHLVGRNVMQC